MIRDVDGNCTQEYLNLPLEYFATKKLSAKYETANEPMTDSLTISSRTICEYLQVAEEASTMVDNKRGFSETIKPIGRKRRRDVTPEQVDEETEAKCQKTREQQKHAIQK